MTDFRDRIHELEDIVAEDLGIDSVSVGYGYKSLLKYLQGDRELDTGIRKRIHEYTVFLHTLPVWVNKYELDSDESISFNPCSGTVNQLSQAPSTFVEAHLPSYPEQELWNKHKTDYQHLENPAEAETTHHNRPDSLLTSAGVDKISWGAKSSPPAIDKSRLMRMCSRVEYERVAEEIGSEVPENYSECIKLVQTVAETEPKPKLYEKWKGFQNEAEYIIECKHNPIEDYSQILWYGLVYQTDIILVNRHSIDNSGFIGDIENLPVNVHIVSNVGVNTGVSRARSKLSEVIQ